MTDQESNPHRTANPPGTWSNGGKSWDGDDVIDIKPRMVGRVGVCDSGCGFFREELLSDFCDFDGSEFTDDGEVCQVWAQRMAAWAEEAKSLMNLSRIAIEQYGDRTGMLAANLRTLAEDYPGKQPTSRQVKDGE